MDRAGTAMNFETAADPSIRPQIGRQATPTALPLAESAAAATPATSRAAASEVGAKADFETQAADLSFADLLDIINPLQHVPVLSDLYRDLTGDTIKPQARVLGGMLFGGPVGLVSSIASVAAEETGGQDLGGTVMATLFGPDTPGEPVVAATSGQQQATLPGDPAQPAAPPATTALAATTPEPPTTQAPAIAATTEPPRRAPQPDNDAPVAPPAAAAEPPANAEQAGPTTAQKADTEQPAVAATQAPDGVLTGKAAIAAYLNDMRAVARAASVPPTTTPAATATTGSATTGLATTGLAATPAEPEPQVPANLVGLGLRDQRGKLAPGVAFNRAVTLPHGLPTTPKAQQEGADQAAAALQSPQLPASTTGLPAAVLTAASAASSGPASPTAGETFDFSQQMMHALKKYESMIEGRQDGAPQPK